MKKFEYKYMNEAMAAEIDGLWAEHGEALEAFAMDAIEAWKFGFKHGFTKSVIAGLIGGCVVGTAFVLTRTGYNHIVEHLGKKDEELEESEEK